ncbi:MAG: hypothetical protein RR686_18985 [Morganella sp. (in: enterobacteria)]
MEPTEFEKWCAGELGYEPEYIMTHREKLQSGEFIYTLFGVETRYRAYTAGVTSMLPYQTPAKGDEDEMD